LNFRHFQGRPRSQRAETPQLCNFFLPPTAKSSLIKGDPMIF